MRGAERPAAKVGDFDGLAGLRTVAVEKVAGEDPRVTGRDSVGSFAVDADFEHVSGGRTGRPAPLAYRMASKRAIRSSVEGWVENRRIRLWPVNGLTMNMCAVDGLASIGIRLDHVSSFCSPPISG